MRSFFRSHWKAIVAIVLLAVLALVTVNPGAATLEPPLPVRLHAHVLALQAPGAPDTRRADASAYIDGVLRLAGYRVTHLPAPDGGAHDLEATLANVPAHGRPERTFVIGARLDAQQRDGPPAAADGAEPVRDDAGGTAAVLEVARLLKDLRPSPGTRIRFVFFLDPRPAAAVTAPGGGSFVAYVGTPGSARQVQDALAGFQDDGALGGHGLAARAYMQGITLSGGAAYGQAGAGMAAVTVTDTAFDRFPYRQVGEQEEEGFGDGAARDGRDGRDYDGIARVVAGLARTVKALAAGQRG